VVVRRQRVKRRLSHPFVDPGGCEVQGVILRPVPCCDCGFQSRRGHCCLSVSAVCCKLINRSVESWWVLCVCVCVNECDCEALIMIRSWPKGDVAPRTKVSIVLSFSFSNHVPQTEPSQLLQWHAGWCRLRDLYGDLRHPFWGMCLLLHSSEKSGEWWLQRQTDRQTYKAAMSSDLLPESRCSKTYAIHIVSDSLLLGVIVHRPSIL